MRARDIKPGFYKNEQLAECSIMARLIFPGLWMIADREGRLEYRPKRIKAELLPFDNADMAELLGELESNGLIVVYDVGGSKYIWIPTFSRHQRPHTNEKVSEIPPCEQALAAKAGTPCGLGDKDLSPRSEALRPSSLSPSSLSPEKNTPTTPSSTVNQDRARALNVVGGVPDDFPPGEVLPEEPCIEFEELREYWNRECRAEGPLTGWKEFKQCRAARKWPGVGRISQDVETRVNGGHWVAGKIVSLSRYLAERFWESTPTRVVPRASPPTDGNSLQAVMDKNAATFRRVAERRAKGGVA